MLKAFLTVEIVGFFSDLFFLAVTISHLFRRCLKVSTVVGKREVVWEKGTGELALFCDHTHTHTPTHQLHYFALNLCPEKIH